MNTLKHNKEPYASKVFKNIQKQINLKHSNQRLMLGKYDILYFNINSIVNKLDEIEIHLYELLKTHSNTFIHCIALTEVRLHEQQTSFFNIPHYTAFFSTRADGYGGSALYVHDSINAHLIEKKSTNNIEYVLVNLFELSASVAVVYKQPSVNDDLFIDFMHRFIENKKNIIIVGDMNLNLLVDTNTIKQYVDTVSSNGYIVLNKITDTFATRSATRTHNNSITTSNTLIDHVLTDCAHFSFRLSQCDTSLSDHREILLSIDNNKSADFISANRTFTYTKINNEPYNNELQHLLETENFATFDGLVSSIIACKNRNSELVSVTRKVNPMKPSITPDLLNLINDRKRYFLLRKKSPTNIYLINKYATICEEIKKKQFKCDKQTFKQSKTYVG